MSRVAVLKGGRSLERSRLAELRLARRGRARAARPRGPADRRRRRPGAAAARRAARRGVHRPARRAAARTARSRSCSSCSGSRTPGSGPAACARCWDKVLAKHVLATPASRRRASTPSPRPRSRTSAPREALPEIERELGFPLVVKPARGGSALGIKFARVGRGRPRRAASPPSPTTPGAAGAVRRGPRARRVGARRRAAAGDRGGPGRRGLLRLRGPLRDRPHDFVCPARLPDDDTARAQELAVATWRALGCRGFARVDLLRDAGPAS